MKEKQHKLKKAQKKKLKSMFFKIVARTFVICFIILGVVAAAYKFFIYDDGQGTGDKKPRFTLKGKDINQTLAVFGVDKEGYRTDVIVVINYNSKTNKAKVVSVPRDTRVDWTEGQQQKLQEYKGTSVTTSKINEMTSYGGIEHIRDFTIDEIENMLSIDIDYYVIVTTDAFRKTVDAIGGVEVDVPALDGDGLHYDDYAQDLHIDLDPGIQVLDGEQAEGLVRFRKGYAEGDVGRIKTQQIFLKSFAKKILDAKTLAKLPKIVPVIFTSVKTDMPLTEIPKYYSYLKKFELANLSFNIIPGEPKYQNSKSYFVPNRDEMKPFVDKVFYDKPTAGEEVAVITEDKTVTIEVLNATDIKGKAQEEKNKLENAGYHVASINNYNQGSLKNTVIYAKNIAKAEQFKKYFINATVKLNNAMSYDIQIVLGEDIKEGE